MVAIVETLSARSTSLKRAYSIQSRGCKAVIDADGSVRVFDSLVERRSLFGREQPVFYKIQAGIVVQAQRPDWVIRLTPISTHLSGRLFDTIEVTQSLEFYAGQSLGYLRRLKLKNAGRSPILLRVINLVDPSAAHFGGQARRWGALGVNAFNRDSHVAMDEVSDPPSARVVGASPSPAKIYMTNNRIRAQEVLASGELPEKTAGISGQVLILSLHEIELAPGDGEELLFASIYNPGRLEQALVEFGRIQSGEKQPKASRFLVTCSDQAVSESAAWAASAIEASAYSNDLLERFEALKGLSLIDPMLVRHVIGESKASLRRDGSLPHSSEPTKPGILETTLMLQGMAFHLMLSQDKKLVRTTYPMVKRLAGYLMLTSKDYRIETDSSLPQGWRRRLGKGFPTGEVPEVSLAAAGALEAASQVSRMISRANDASRFRERSELISEQVRKRLLDGRGFFVLCRDSSGRLRNDETIDMAVSAYRHPFKGEAERAVAHRLLERDFDTKFGPRCVPTSNQVYFNPSYGEGQLGGVWTRAVLAFALMCYRAGLAGIGSLSLAKVARVVAEDMPRLGGSPGTFPQWVDVEGGEAHGDDSDSVAAAKFIEVLFEGEFGLQANAERISLVPATTSCLGWVLAVEAWAGEPTSVFIGRCRGKSHTFFVGSKVDPKSGMEFARCERLEVPYRGVYILSFDTPGQVICIGNSTASQAKFAISFTPRAAELSRRLSTPLEKYDAIKETWAKIGSLRVTPNMCFDTAVEPNSWEVFRISTP